MTSNTASLDQSGSPAPGPCSGQSEPAPVAQPASSDPATRMVLAKWIEQLESFANLASGWDRHGAPAPNPEAIAAARQFIEALVNEGQPPTRVAASAVGGIGVTRRAGERMAFVEFYNAGPPCALLADDAGDERVLEVVPEHGTFRALLSEVKAYLNG